MRIPLNFTGFASVKKFAYDSSNFSGLITKPTKCWSNEFYRDSSKVCWNEFSGVTQDLIDDNFPESGLAVAVWAVVVICFIAFFFGVLLVVGMTILVLLSFHHLMSLKKSLKSQVRLLMAINKQLRRSSNLYLRDVGCRMDIQDLRYYHNNRPQRQHIRHAHVAHHAPNAPFHPRNNTPVSSYNGSFSSHASFSLSDMPSVSSFSPSVSEDVANSDFTASSKVTTIHPVSGRSFQRYQEDVPENERQVRETREVHGNYRMYDKRREDLVPPANGRRVCLQNCPPITSYEPIGQSDIRSPKEYWL